jgi:hypothetical protein
MEIYPVKAIRCIGAKRQGGLSLADSANGIAGDPARSHALACATPFIADGGPHELGLVENLFAYAGF